MTAALRKISASSVSAALRRGGLLPVPTTRDGLHVRGGGLSATSVSVIGSVCDSDRQSLRLAKDAEEVLLEAGYEVDRDGDRLVVTRLLIARVITEPGATVTDLLAPGLYTKATAVRSRLIAVGEAPGAYGTSIRQARDINARRALSSNQEGI